MDRIASKIKIEFSAVTDELVERKLLIDSCSLVPFETEHRTMLSWSGGSHLSYLYGEYSTLEHYRAILYQRDFCLCFADGGLVQIRYDIEHEEIVSHRLCYFPCPFCFEAEELVGISLSDMPLLFSAEELMTRLRLASPIRFDFDANITDERHTNSHVSLNKETCRLPAYGPVSLGHFFRFILRYFYQEDFSNLVESEYFTPQFFGRTLKHPAPHEFYLDTNSRY